MNRTNGFSLIEILIATAVMASLTGVGISRYTTFNDRQKLKTAADNFVTHLHLIQKTVNGGVKGNCTDVYTGYTLTRTTGGGAPQATLTINCPSLADPNDRIISQYRPINGAGISGNSLSTTASQPKNQPIVYKTLGQGIEGTVDKVIKLEIEPCEIEIKVSPGGTITVGDVTGC
jgi:prepilin-type N-terminal cleavage/methylation domain-containing protein